MSLLFVVIKYGNAVLRISATSTDALEKTAN